MRRVLAIGLVAACSGGSGGGGGGEDAGNEVTLVGECEPAVDSVELGARPIGIFDGSCLGQDPVRIQVVESEADWTALFGACAQPVPAELDLAANRAAIVHLACTPIDFRFGAETDREIVIGVMARVSGACLGNILVVPLPRSTKPVRLAECREDCPSCPPVP